MKTTTTSTMCQKLREVFARFGVPRVIVSDNGPQFTSEEFQSFCRANVVQHIRSTPYHPKTNGLAERAVRTFKERMLAARHTTADISTRLQKFLLSYRNTPQKSTGRPPAEMMFGHRLRTCLDLIKPDVRAKMDTENFRQQRDHDKAAQPRSFAEGDPVWVANNIGQGQQQGKVVRRTGPLSYVVSVNGKTIRKHADQLRFRRIADTDRGVSEIDAELDDQEECVSVLPKKEPLPPNQPTQTAGNVPKVPPLRVQTDSAPEDVAAPEAVPDKGQPARTSPRIDGVPPTQPLRRSQRTRRCPVVPYDKYL